MTNLPFGFGTGDSEPSGGNPDDLLGKIPFFAELQKLMSWTGGPVNWDLARQIAISTLAADHRPVADTERAAVADAVRVADVWLDETTSLPSGVTSAEVWSRVDWIERSLPVWSALCDPVAAQVVGSMSSLVPQEMAAQLGPMAGLMNQFGGMMFGAQVGQGLGGLAREVISASDVGLPLGPPGVAALVPENVASFGAGLGRPDGEVQLFVALREAAYQRLFGHVPWLRQRLIDTVEGYARGITIDTSAIERAMGEIDPMNPESIQQALAGGMVEPEQTPQQQAALRRLETLLALVEGWVDTVVAAAAGERMPGAAALRETVRRRRASGGPAEQTFATLVGLELRPRRLREAAALWWALTERHGVQARDEVWAHPDLLPDAEDLDDPLGFAERYGSDPLAGFEEALGELPGAAQPGDAPSPGERRDDEPPPSAPA